MAVNEVAVAEVRGLRRGPLSQGAKRWMQRVWKRQPGGTCVGLGMYAPADKPRIALAVLVAYGGFGAQSAAPIARRLFDYVLTGGTKKGSAPAIAGPDAEDESD